MTARPTSLPPFDDGRRVWTCHVTDDGQRYEWRADCRRMAVRREGRTWRAATNGSWSSHEYPDVRAAMAGAVANLLRTGAVA